MKMKTIEHTIREKMEDWLRSIKDESLQNSVRKNYMVSGGCITSMLLGEKVNDYDVYLSDMDLLVELADYYVDDELEITVLDGRKRSEYLSAKGLEDRENDDGGFVTSYKKLCIQNLKPNQVKFLFSGVNGGMKMDKPKDETKTYYPKYISSNAISLSDGVQIVTRFCGTPEEIHKTFDFIHATNYFVRYDGLKLNTEALSSTLTKELMYQGSQYPLTSIIRMKKFLLRGWSITAGEILKIMFQISKLDLTDLNVLEDQLIGVDVVYFTSLINELRKTEMDMTSANLNSLIDKVFRDTKEGEDDQ
jgi:hypothetical protein